MERHEVQVAEGKHDDDCEFGPHERTGQGRIFMHMCHCSKRRREAAGFTTPPDEDLVFPPPKCPRCEERVTWDDGWACYRCCLSWDSDGRGDSCEFTDDYGEAFDRV